MNKTKRKFICPTCNIEWEDTPDKDGLFKGRGMSLCPTCGECGYNPNDYFDYHCNYCGYSWRQYGNGGLVLGCIPRCPKCKS